MNNELKKIMELKKNASLKAVEVTEKKKSRKRACRNSERAVSIYKEWLKVGGPDKYGKKISRAIKEALPDVPESTIYTYTWRWFSGFTLPPTLEKVKTEEKPKKEKKTKK